MLIDARDFPQDHRLTADLVIIGAGPAGISLARSFVGSRLRVCLLESGGFTADRKIQSLYDGEVSDPDGVLPVGHSYLTDTRLRIFGGGTDQWGGWSRPLDELDFQIREWVPDSGWPFSLSDIEPYYARARKIVGIKHFEYDPEELPLKHAAFALAEKRCLITKLYHYSSPVRFGKAFRRELISAPNIDLVLHANALEVLPMTGQGRIASVSATTLNRRNFSIEGTTFVLATGGVENARLLLVSKSSSYPEGIGNDRGLVGRYFMEHPHVSLGEVALWKPLSKIMLYYERYHESHFNHRILGAFCPNRETQAREHLLNFSCQFWPGKKRKMSAEDFDAFSSAFRLDSRDNGEAPTMKDSFYGELFFRFEQAPSANSRVTLSEQFDVFGRPKARLSWRLSNQDYDSFTKAVNLVGKELSASRMGGAKMIDPGHRDFISIFGNHHMGTTRMHPSPDHGVVDADCKVHGVHNLYVIGSSVFPTVGYANPTLTILALTERFADHLKQSGSVYS